MAAMRFTAACFAATRATGADDAIEKAAGIPKPQDAFEQSIGPNSLS